MLMLLRERARAQALNKFFDNTMQAILRHIDFAVVKCVILASPGFVKVSQRACTNEPIDRVCACTSWPLR